MPTDECLSCGRPLPPRTGRRGRSSVYCSPACRQKAYRDRSTPAPGEVVPELIADIERRVQGLAPQLPAEFYSDVTALSSSVGRLHRVARVARDAAQSDAAQCDAAQSDAARSHAENVTQPPVTQTPQTPETPNDESAFAGTVEAHRAELQVHCYRMVGSYNDAEDLVQETFLRAWRGRDGFAGRSSLRAWLYRIATNACLDFLRRNTRRPQRYEPLPGIDSGTAEPPRRITWLQPYPDRQLADVASDEAQPDAEVVSKETLELVFLAAIQHLPPRQRAVLILRDVLEWPAAVAAELLEMSVASVNSALQRARPTLRGHLPERRSEWAASTEPTEAENAILHRYMTAAAQADLDAMAQMLREDARLTMPPNPFWFVGREPILNFISVAMDPSSPSYLGSWRHLTTRANRQPALGGYVCRPGTTVYRAQVLDVLRIEDGKIAEITSFEPHLFPAFGLPLTL
jgi:RNA polymerase sigma-70 factor (TIGR02960 family)